MARWFGIDPRQQTGKRVPRKTDPDLRADKRRRRQFLRDLGHLALRRGHVTLITGPSGSGKSSLLRQVRHEYGKSIQWTDLASLALPHRPLVDCFGKRKLPDVLMQLSGVGLGEAWSYLKTPRELSEGQRWRLRLAIGLHEAQGRSRASQRLEPPGTSDGWSEEGRGIERDPDGSWTDPDDPPVSSSEGTDEPGAIRAGVSAPAVLLCDEFAAVLDRVTACVVSRALRRNVDHLPGLCAVVATSHEDLIDALSPDVIVRCDFGRVTVEETRDHHRDTENTEGRGKR